MKLRSIFSWFVLGMTISVVHAAAIDDGIAALEAGEYEQALGLLNPLAEQGDVVAQVKMGMLYANGWGVKRDGHTALKWFQQAAEQGNAEAAFNVGQLYGKNVGLPGIQIDLKEANKWYRIAAEKGYAAAQYNLGANYFKGAGVDATDYVTGYAWISVAETQNHPFAKDYRELIETILSPEELTKAKARAEELREKYGRQEAETQ